MSEKGILNEGLRKHQKQSVNTTEAKIIKALDKQKHATKINISKLGRDSGVSRQQITDKYSYLYDGRVNESKQVTKLKEQIRELKNDVKKHKQEKQVFASQNNELTNKLVQLYAIIDDLNS